MKDIIVKVNEEDLGTLLLCSMRYSIGRHTYMPSLVCRIIKSHKDSLSPVSKQMLADNIRSELTALEFWNKKEPNSLNTKVKLEEKAEWEKLILHLLEE